MNEPAQAMHDIVPAATSPVVVAHLRSMRGWLRALALSVLVFILWIGAYGGAFVVALIGGAPGLGGVAGGAYVALGVAVFLPARLLWRQADAADRFVAAPSDELFAVFAREMRRFWRVSTLGVVGVLLLTVAWWVALIVVPS